MLFLNVWNVHLHRINIVKETDLSMFHLGAFLNFLLIATKWNLIQLNFIFGNLMMVSVSLFELFPVCPLLANVLIMHVMITEMAVFNSFQVMTLTSGLVSKITGLFHLCLSLIIFLYPKLELKMSCSVTQNIALI